MSYSFGDLPQCAPGEVLSGDGICITPEDFDRLANDKLAHLPPPCNDIDNMRAMYESIGVATARPGDPPEKMQQAGIEILSWCKDSGIDCRDDEAVCAALVEQSGRGGNAKGMSTEVKVAIGVGVVAALGGIAYLALK